MYVHAFSIKVDRYFKGKMHFKKTAISCKSFYDPNLGTDD